MIISTAAVFLAFTFFLLGFYQALRGEHLKISRRVEEVLGSPGLSFREQELKAPFRQRVVRPVFRKMFKLACVLIPAEKTAVLEEKLVRAGRPGGLSAGEYAVLKYFAAGAAGVFLCFLSGVARLEPVQTCLLSLPGILLGWHLPNFYLEARIRERAELIRRELPDVLDLLTVSVEAGLGFDGALLKVGEKKKSLLAEEFAQILREINMGKPRREALRDASRRIGVDEFSSFVGSLIVADRLGISMAGVLRAQSAQMREKRRQRAEERAMKAPVKMLFPMVFLIFPAVFLVLLGPAVIKISEVFTR
ncbi:type II secretion system F family protein [Desulfofundulus sp.]|uniref:type II secretion system F family protein n=1 Tax=Desulfofundulus sp. TaxID=2282750 RepID=UPI003C77BB86